MSREVDIPRSIGRFRIDRLLGSGAMGYVFLGHDPELDRPVAVKTLRDLSMAKEARNTFMSRFRNEARAAARLQHPNIVQVYDVGEEPEIGPYLVFEYIPGSNLKQLLRAEGPLSPEQAIWLAEELGAALDAAHAAGIIHRDIKPDNVLLTDFGVAKLADFGVARLPDASLTREGQFLGTPCYAAPETLTNADYSRVSDVFSLGALLYEAICGERAFPGSEAVAVAHKVVNDAPVLPSKQAPQFQIPRAVDQVILRALAKSPDGRFQSCGELSEALRAAYESTGILAPMSRSYNSRVEIEIPQGEESRVMVSFALLVLAGLVFGLVVFQIFDPVVFGTESQMQDAAVQATSPADEIDAGEEAPEDTVFDALVDTELDANLDAGAKDELDAAKENSDAADVGQHEESQIDIDAMSERDREEAAKSALNRARKALAEGDKTSAQKEIDLVKKLDPTHPDIRTLSGQI